MLAAGMALWAVWPELCRSFGAHGGPEGQAPSAHPAGEGAGSVATRGLPSASAPAPSLFVHRVQGSAFPHSEAAEGDLCEAVLPRFVTVCCGFPPASPGAFCLDC